MTHIEPSLGLTVASLLCACGLAVTSRGYVLSPRGRAIGKQLQDYERKLDRQLRFVRWGVAPRFVMALQAVGAVGAVVLSASDLMVGLLLLVAVLSVTPALKRARRQRVSAIEKQIEGWLGSLARSLEAAPSLGEALEVSVEMCDAPLRDELKVLVNEINLGRPIDRTLHLWGERVGSRTLSLALSTLQVGRETGGRLGDVLNKSAASLREMERLEGVVRTKTAEGKAQAWVISIIPFPLYFAVKAGDPNYFVPLETTSTGHLLLAIAAVLWVAAGLSARKILAVQI